MADTPPRARPAAAPELDELALPADQPPAKADKPPAGTRSTRSAINRQRAANARAAKAAASGDLEGARQARSEVGSTARINLERKLLEQLGWIGMGVAAIDPVCGPAILDGSERLAAALARLADENPRIKRVLTASLEGSAWAELFVAVGMIALPMAAHHGLIPTSPFPSIQHPQPSADQPS